MVTTPQNPPTAVIVGDDSVPMQYRTENWQLGPLEYCVTCASPSSLCARKCLLRVCIVAIAMDAAQLRTLWVVFHGKSADKLYFTFNC